MDAFLARKGFFVAWAVMGIGFGLDGSGEHRPLRNGFGGLLGWVALPVLMRAVALRADRVYAWAPARPRRVRAVLLGHRWLVAVLYGAGAGWFAQWHYDVPWFSALHGVVSGVAAAYAARPLPVTAAPPPP